MEHDKQKKETDSTHETASSYILSIIVMKT